MKDLKEIEMKYIGLRMYGIEYKRDTDYTIQINSR
jgi:hypothetical protein